LIIEVCCRTKLINPDFKKFLLVLGCFSKNLLRTKKSWKVNLCSLSGQEILTLEKAISIGMENNFSIKINEKNIEIAENNDTWVNTGKTPTIDLNAGFNNNFTNDNNPASFLQGTYYNGSLNGALTGNWVFYNGGRFKISKQQLELAVRQEYLNK